MNTILENNKNNMDIILIQEPPKSLIRHVPSHTDPTGDPIYGTPNHPDRTQLKKAMHELQHTSTKNC